MTECHCVFSHGRKGGDIALTAAGPLARLDRPECIKGRTLLVCPHRPITRDSSTHGISALAGQYSPLPPPFCTQLVVVDDQEAGVGITWLGIREGLRIAHQKSEVIGNGGRNSLRLSTRRTFVASLVRKVVSSGVFKPMYCDFLPPLQPGSLRFPSHLTTALNDGRRKAFPHQLKRRQACRPVPIRRPR